MKPAYLWKRQHSSAHESQREDFSMVYHTSQPFLFPQGNCYQWKAIIFSLPKLLCRNSILEDFTIQELLGNEHFHDQKGWNRIFKKPSIDRNYYRNDFVNTPTIFSQAWSPSPKGMCKLVISITADKSKLKNKFFTFQVKKFVFMIHFPLLE